MFKRTIALTGSAFALIFRGASMQGPKAVTRTDDDLIPRWLSASMIDAVVVGGQTNP